MLSPHPSAALEYWFFKVNSGPVALIVDWIERRRDREHWIRASVHSPHQREVIFEKMASFMPRDNFLGTHRTAGHAGEAAWDLEISAARDWIKPDIFPAGLLQMADLSVISAPLVQFTGWIRHGSQQATLSQVPGLVSHYWGRRLIPEWWWVSAHQFDREDIVVECSVFRSRLWGSSIQIPLAYLYLRQGNHKEFSVAPLNMAHVEGTPGKFQIEIRRFRGEKVTLIGTGREYGDFGDGIVNTLTGDLEICLGSRVLACARGTAGLERRAPEAVLP